MKNKKSLQLTKAFLTCGVILTPFFFGVAIPQMILRPGFDIRRHAISSLSLGDLGWIQITNFLVIGLLSILLAIGLRRTLRGSRGGTWAPILVGIYGIGMIIAGIFPPPAGFGFPPGAPAGMPKEYGFNGMMHSVGFFTAFISLIVACFVFSRRFASLKERSWMLYCIATGVTAPLLIILGMIVPGAPGICFALAGAVAFGCLSILSKKFLSALSKG